MFKNVLFLFITLNLLGCNINTKFSNLSDRNFNPQNSSSYVGNYLTASYSITKGDAYTASRILDEDISNLKLLEIKFFSNLVSGNFYNADKVSHKLKVNGENKTLYDLPQYILNIKNNDLRGSLEVFENQELFFNLDALNDLIKFWIEETKNTNGWR